VGLRISRIDSQRLSVMFNRLSYFTPLEQSLAQVVVGIRISRIISQRLSVMFNRLSYFTPLE